ncbi:MAG: hypothetical protein LBB94_06135 [Clostridiales bacterium]|jgi:type II secretory pathway pseudopilin PulG|nr:hypothetical protein [Clostridiales bacterium]
MCVRGRNSEGYTLLESLLAVTVAAFVLTAALRLLSCVSISTSRAAVRAELTECARLAADVMSANIQRASAIKIELYENKKNTLKRLELIEPEQGVFSYNPYAPVSVSNYHRLIFSGDKGSNELASNLADIRIISSGEDTLFIEILTDGAITVNSGAAIKNSTISVGSIFIRVPVNISGKKLLQ